MWISGKELTIEEIREYRITGEVSSLISPPDEHHYVWNNKVFKKQTELSGQLYCRKCDSAVINYQGNGAPYKCGNCSKFDKCKGYEMYSKKEVCSVSGSIDPDREYVRRTRKNVTLVVFREEPLLNHMHPNRCAFIQEN